jgi:hypothetical protein
MRARSHQVKIIMHHSHLFVVASVAIAIVASHRSSHAATAYKCVIDGKTTWQDLPCATENAKTMRTPDYEPDVQKIEREVAECGANQSDFCKITRLRVATREKINREVEKNGEARRIATIRDENRAIDARLAHRVAKEDYERLDRALKHARGEHFDALLAARSEASDRLRKANTAHYNATNKWLD